MSEKKGFNRRDFLKVIGAGSGLALAGCSEELPEKIIPYVIQPDEVVPGVASWYSGTCTECSAGCGILVKTREGRAIKVEGNPKHPINKGGLCALSQSSLQSLYNPDRVREPQVRESNKTFQSASWNDAVEKIATAIKDAPDNKKTVLVTKPLSGSIKSLIAELSSSLKNFKHIEFDLINTDAIDIASEKSFGKGVKTIFDFSKADTVVSFGADFLETWNSPVEYSLQWASRRNIRDKDSKRPISYVYHFEPRLSLTASNADKWVMNSPSSEKKIMLALILLLKERVNKYSFNKNVSGLVDTLTKNSSSVDELLKGTSVTAEVLGDVAHKLIKSENSLVVAGGASTSADAVKNAMYANLINALLGNIGSTVKLVQSESKPAGIAEVEKLIKEMESGVSVMLVAGVNPVFSLPADVGFDKALANVDTLVNLAISSDETSELSHVVLPLSSSLESWGDSNPRPGVFNLNQPSMQPVFKSQSLGDSLIAIAGKLDVKVKGVRSFLDYIKLQWKKKLGEANFEKNFNKVIQSGGEWGPSLTGAVDLDKAKISKFKAVASDFTFKEPAEDKTGLKILSFPTIKSRDGSSANRPWMQELPDPLTTAVWGSWLEINPKTAKGFGLETGSVAKVGTEKGSIELPVYITKHIHPELVAVPIGQGHESYGRYADGVGANPLKLLSGKLVDGILPLIVGGVSVQKSISKDKLVQTGGHDYQLNRGMIRKVSIDEYKKSSDKHKDHGHGDKHDGDKHGGDHKGGHAAGHHDPLALGPQEPPRQMYKQMDHPVYRWGMSVDISSCTGCSACVVACNAENNIPMVGKELVSEGREMSWIRIDRYFEENDDAAQPVTGFAPSMCQHCGNAPCEPVCPVYATYHNEEGLNQMVYNRCVGTRYCANNCSYKVRRFNWFHYKWPEPLTWQLNPDVTVREVGVMEKCTFCVQRIKEVQNNAKDLGRPVQDGEIQPACASSCPTKAIKFGNLKDHKSEVYKDSQDSRAYKVLDANINTQPAVSYLAKITHEKGDNKKKDHH